MASLQARNFNQRSPLAHRHVGATLGPMGDSVIVARYGQLDEKAQLQRCALLDLSNLPRVGFRGAHTAEYLRQRRYDVGPAQSGRGAGGWQPCSAALAE